MTAGSALKWGAAARWCFGAYAATLFVATHWPNLKIEGTGRPDLFVHVAAFGLFAALMIVARFFGPALSIRNIGAVAVIATVYAGIDEWMQAIPWIKRHAAWDDWLADVGGIAIACGGALVMRAFWRPGDAETSVPSGPP